MNLDAHPKIITGKEREILRKAAQPVANITPEIQDFILEMRRIMKEADGIGLAAPQIGKPLRLFIAEVNKKFYALINPEIIKISKEKTTMEEGCLSLPGIFGEVERPDKITIVGLDQNGKKVKIKAWGLLARVFQHEMDHLNGKLFVDRTKTVYRLAPKENAN